MEKASFVDTEANLSPSPERVKGGEMAMFSLQTLKGVIYEEVQKELRAPLDKKIYKQMQNDNSIASPYTLIKMMVAGPDWKASCPKGASAEEKKRQKMLNYMMKTTKRDWSEYIVEMMSYIIYGHWPGEKIDKVMKTPHGTFKGITDLKTISQDTVGRWHFDDPTGDLLGLQQDLSRIVHGTLGQLTGKVDLPRVKFLLLRNSPQRDNPEGESLLKAIYIIWKYKALTEEYLTIGVIKDMSGVPMFGVPATVLATAAKDPTSNQAKQVAQLERMASALHNGDLNHIIIPTEYEGSNPMYTAKLMEGGSRQYDSLSIIKYYNQQILIRFFSDILSLGSDGSGSHALSDNKLTLVEVACTHHLKTIKRMLNHDLMRFIYMRNRWEYDPETSCYFDYDNPNDGDIATFAKAAQQLVASGAVRVTKDMEDKARDVVWDLMPTDEDTEFLETKNVSGASRGMEDGLGDGVGDSSTFGMDNNANNLAKKWIK